MGLIASQIPVMEVLSIGGNKMKHPDTVPPSIARYCFFCATARVECKYIIPMQIYHFSLTKLDKRMEGLVGFCRFVAIDSMYVCMVTHIARVWTNRVRLPILLVVT